LKKAGLNPWLDKKNIRGGQNWKNAIKDGIKNNRYFIPLLSTKSVRKRGYSHKELKYALDILDEYPPNTVFIIPVRLDKCNIPYEKLSDIQFIDMFPRARWSKGVKEILQSMEINPQVSLEKRRPRDESVKLEGHQDIFTKKPVDYTHESKSRTIEKEPKKPSFNSMSKLLQEGNVKEFNRLREKFPNYTIYLTEANLSGKNLYRANLSGVNLLRANLSHAVLTEADLSNANLSGAFLLGVHLNDANLAGANLTDADLTQANLLDTNLTRATLFNANLTDANLYRTDLSSANLVSAILVRARLEDTNFSFSTLRNIKEYEGVKCDNCDFNNTIINNQELVNFLKSTNAKNVPGVTDD